MKKDFLVNDPMLPDNNTLLNMTSMIDLIYPQMEDLQQTFFQTLGEIFFFN